MVEILRDLIFASRKNRSLFSYFINQRILELNWASSFLYERKTVLYTRVTPGVTPRNRRHVHFRKSNSVIGRWRHEYNRKIPIAQVYFTLCYSMLCATPHVSWRWCNLVLQLLWFLGCTTFPGDNVLREWEDRCTTCLSCPLAFGLWRTWHKEERSVFHHVDRGAQDGKEEEVDWYRAWPCQSDDKCFGHLDWWWWWDVPVGTFLFCLPMDRERLHLHAWFSLALFHLPHDTGAPHWFYYQRTHLRGLRGSTNL